jgi:hypothetical protein
MGRGDARPPAKDTDPIPATGGPDPPSGPQPRAPTLAERQALGVPHSHQFTNAAPAEVWATLPNAKHLPETDVPVHRVP